MFGLSTELITKGKEIRVMTLRENLFTVPKLALVINSVDKTKQSFLLPTGSAPQCLQKLASLFSQVMLVKSAI